MEKRKKYYLCKVIIFKMKRIITAYILSFYCFTLAAQPDSLSHYLEIAAQNNPGVKSAFASYKAALQKVSQAGAYSDPQLDMGFFLKPMELIDGRQIAEFKLMQMFPWFGTQKAARTEAQHMAQMTFEQFCETRDQLFLDIYTQWFALCRLRQQLINMHTNKTWLLQMEELALKRFASPSDNPASTNSASVASIPESLPYSGNMSSTMGNMKTAQTDTPMNLQESMSTMGSSSSGMSSVLRIQLEIAEIDNNIESLSSDILAGKAIFNALLNRPLDNDVIIPDTIIQIPFLLNDSAALEELKQQNPMLRMLKEENEAYKAKSVMDRKMSYPMFGIGVQYMLINKSKPTASSSMEMETTSINSMNGKDMLMPMITVTIPVFRGKYKALQRETSFLQQANNDKYLNTINMLESEFYRLKNELNNASRKINLYKKQLEISQILSNLTMQEWISGKSELTNVIQAQRQLLNYNLKVAEAVATYNITVANIQKVISRY
jgi:outer membrane protein TolC